MRKITQFNGDFEFLSNFHVEPDMSCVEVEYQMSKCAKAEDQYQFVDLSPQAAKRLGRSVELRSDWELIKVSRMHHLVLSKFQDWIYLRDLLLSTGNAELIEGNIWGDTFWGVCKGVGENHLGKILMQVRSALFIEYVTRDPFPHRVVYTRI